MKKFEPQDFERFERYVLPERYGVGVPDRDSDVEVQVQPQMTVAGAMPLNLIPDTVTESES